MTKRATIIPFIIISIFLLVFGIYSQWPATITPDAAMHAEIVAMISQQGFLTSWEPYAANDYTYPPLFHYLAFLLPLEPIDAVRALGLVLWLIFPLAIYFLVSTYRKDAALVAAVFIAVLPSFSNIFIYSEFPQLLAMLLFVGQWYFLRRGKYHAAAVFCGLVVLSHVFVALVAVALQLAYLGKVRVRWLTTVPIWELVRNSLRGAGVRPAFASSRRFAQGRFAQLYSLPRRTTHQHVISHQLLWLRARSALHFAPTLFIPLVVASPWIPAYVRIIGHTLSGSWENVRYNAFQPVFGFWPAQTIIDWLFGVHGLTPLLLPFAFWGFLKVKDWWLRGFFVFGLLFTAFHLPFTQLKIYDLLALPVVVLAALGIVALGMKRKHFYVFVVCIIAVLAVLQVQHFANSRVNWFYPDIAPTPELVNAAEWLAAYDGQQARMYAHQASAWAGILAKKLPLDPDITHLEAFSNEYKEQLAVQKEIKERLMRGESVREIVQERNIRYVLVPATISTDLAFLYSNGAWAVYASD